VRRRPHRVEHVARVHDEVHVPLQDLIHNPLVGALNVNLPLVAVGGGIQPRVAAVAEVRIRDVGYADYTSTFLSRC
jgi:hypothetical protein